MKKKLNIFSNHEALLFLLTIIVRGIVVFYLLEPNSYLKWLPFQNDRRGLDVAAGRVVSHPNVWSSYYLFLGGLYSILKPAGLISYRVQIVAVLNILLAGLGVCIFYRILNIFVNKKNAFISALIFLAYYPSIYLNSLIMSENLFSVSLMTGMLLLTSKSTLRKLAAAGILLGISIVIRPILLAFLPFLGWWLVVHKKKITLAPIAAVMLLVSIVNARMGKTPWKLSSAGENGGVNFAIAQCELKKISYSTVGGDSFWFSPPVFWGTNRSEIKTLVPFSNQGYYYRMGWECLKKNPANLGRNLMHIKNVFGSIFYPDFENSLWHKSMMVFWKAVGVGLLITLLIFPFIKMNQSQSRTRSLLILLFLSLTAAVFWENPGEERYLVPYFFILLISGVVVMAQAGRGTIRRI